MLNHDINVIIYEVLMSELKSILDSSSYAPLAQLVRAHDLHS